MRIGLLSDTHDNLQGVQEAAEIFRREGITRLLHCGDVCGPAVVEALEDFSVTFAQGNVDRVPALGIAVDASQGAGRLARWHRLVLNGASVALLHGDDMGLQFKLTHSGDYAYVFCGHTHRREDTRVGMTRVINPGAVGGTRRESRSVCVLDLAADRARFIELKG